MGRSRQRMPTPMPDFLYLAQVGILLLVQWTALGYVVWRGWRL